MASFNKCTIVGYLGRNPELKHTPQGTAVCKFSVATTERRKDSVGEFQDQTTWFRITAWGRQAELVNEYLSKGKQVYVEGRLRVEEYLDREGNAKHSLEVNASDVQFLGSKGDGEPREQRSDDRDAKRAAMNAQAPAKAKQGTLPGTHKPNIYEHDPTDDEIPFS